ncbi:uncharacterized protein LOC110697422 [Chenopodium quinoa]|uniref:uncharacterized protein LOC110697422 n=1 Tax=Chenopodium quinoa TaxID=63459 RepID=UPI000B77E101|nr:uncharacterized protein LOC110697422 [Chenopodium quinoa]XP_021730491.1 uncharacterized protein LOC110697422 [Chenopodium quinoa]
MAATHGVPAAMVGDKKKQATFEELIAAGREIAALEPKVDAHEEAITRGFIVNHHKKFAPLKLYDQHNWSGRPVPSYPEVVVYQQLDPPIPFKHQGPLPQGSRGGVVYADGVDSTARKWLVAFDLLKQKVYVEAGPIGPIDWNVVEVKLQASGDHKYYEDPVFGGKAEARNDGDIVFAVFSN